MSSEIVTDDGSVVKFKSVDASVCTYVGVGASEVVPMLPVMISDSVVAGASVTGSVVGDGKSFGTVGRIVS